MKDEAICDGDYVIVLRRETAEPGEMVVCVVGDQATIKRYYPEGPVVRLESANRTKPFVRVTASGVHIQGVVVGVMRKL